MKDRILIWNDDNHEPVVYINRKLMGVDFETVIKSALFCKNLGEEKDCEILNLYCWDIEDNDFENEEEFDILFDWFQSMPKMSEEQWDLIFKKDFIKLGKTL